MHFYNKEALHKTYIVIFIKILGWAFYPKTDILQLPQIQPL